MYKSDRIAICHVILDFDSGMAAWRRDPNSAPIAERIAYRELRSTGYAIRNTQYASLFLPHMFGGS
jgi:hypothetical protein